MNRYLRIIILTGSLLINMIAMAQGIPGRIVYSINDGWKFLPQGNAYAETMQFNDDQWQQVSLPHTWNAVDPFDDDRTYTRSIAWYRKQLVLDQTLRSKKVYLYFEGANQVVHVYVNGYFAGMHKGGYTGFSIDITRFLNWKNEQGKNVIALQVSNAHDPFVAPLNVGYASYGGIYRDAWVIATDPIHFTDINNNAAGVYLTTPGVNAQKATISALTNIHNESGKDQSVQLIHTITEATGSVIGSFQKTVLAKTGQTTAIQSSSDIIPQPRLWSPSSPYLYKVTSQLIVDGRMMDKVENAIGFRWFSFNDSTGFSLNGQRLTLKGTNRHQDMKGKGDALSQEDHRRDLQLIKEMGCNFVRLAHYPQAATVLKLADELGLLVWEETPVVNFITDHNEFLQNTNNMIHEMITQGYNHPSVIMWGSTNEILLHGPDGERIGRQNDTAYMRAVKKAALQFDSTVRVEDPSRYSTVAMHISDDYAKYGLDTISQVAGYNIYSGWYSGKTEDFGNDLDSRRKPGHIVFVSEYGAEAELSLNTETPVRFDYTPQYQRYYHEAYLRQINQRPWLGGTAIWNEFDFSQPNIGGPQPHMNQKGLVTWDRKTKDAYYLYKANWNPEPMVYIATRDWLKRAGEKNMLSTIDVYTNGKTVSLMVNGVAQKKSSINDLHKASWKVQLKEGENTLLATTSINGVKVTDQVVVYYEVYDPVLTKSSLMHPLHINVGAAAQYLDPSGTVWIEDRAYQQGSFGYIGGKTALFDRKDVIKNTDDEPMFYSYRDSLSAYRFDVVDGQYNLTLCFAEAARVKPGDRVFSVAVNGQQVVREMDLAATYGFAQAAVKTFVVDARNGQGIQVQFDAKKGNAVLHGIIIEKK